MKFVKLITYGLLFFVIGECMIRVDQSFDLFQKAPHVFDVAMDESDIRKEVGEGSFQLDSNQLRILVLGDSFIKEVGINKQDKFSNKLTDLLTSNPAIQQKVIILDVAKAGNNTRDNYNSFQYYYDKFKPQFVFWSYNMNDILGKLENNKPKQKTGINSDFRPGQIKQKVGGLKGVVKNIYSISRLLEYLSLTAQKELKFLGVTPPYSDFEYITKEAYKDQSEPWIETQKMLSSVNEICDKQNTDFILYKMPDFNLLQELHFFENVDKAFVKFSNAVDHIQYLNGSDDFIDEDGEEYRLSRYDPHPNGKAQLKIANKIAKLIESKSILLKSND